MMSPLEIEFDNTPPQSRGIPYPAGIGGGRKVPQRAHQSPRRRGGAKT